MGGQGTSVLGRGTRMCEGTRARQKNKAPKHRFSAGVDFCPRGDVWQWSGDIFGCYSVEVPLASSGQKPGSLRSASTPYQTYPAPNTNNEKAEELGDVLWKRRRSSREQGKQQAEAPGRSKDQDCVCMAFRERSPSAPPQAALASHCRWGGLDGKPLFLITPDAGSLTPGTQ